MTVPLTPPGREVPLLGGVRGGSRGGRNWQPSGNRTPVSNRLQVELEDLLLHQGRDAVLGKIDTSQQGRNGARGQRSAAPFPVLSLSHLRFRRRPPVPSRSRSKQPRRSCLRARSNYSCRPAAKAFGGGKIEWVVVQRRWNGVLPHTGLRPGVQRDSCSAVNLAAGLLCVSLFRLRQKLSESESLYEMEGTFVRIVHEHRDDKGRAGEGRV